MLLSRDEIDFQDENLFAPQEGMQTLVLLSECEDILAGGGRGSGKSLVGILKWLQHHQMWGNKAKGLVLRRTYPAIEEFVAAAKKVLGKLGWEWKEGKRKFVHKVDGTELKMRHLDDESDAENVQGHEYTFILVEEAGQFETPDPIDLLRATMRSPWGVKMVFLLTANPGGPGTEWLRKRYIDPAPPNTPHPDPRTGLMRVYIPGTILDNPKLLENDPGYIDRLRMSGPPWLVEAWLKGNWHINPDGNAWKREYFQYFDPRYTPPFIRIFQSWDTAYKKEKKHARSACTTWGLTAKKDLYLLDAWADHVEFPQLKQVAIQKCQQWGPHVVYVEAKASGMSLCQEMRTETIIPFREVSVDGDKIARAYSATPVFAAGKVFLPENTPWTHEYISELISFPKGAYCDFVDSTSQAINRIRHIYLGGKTLEGRQSNVVSFNGPIWGI